LELETPDTSGVVRQAQPMLVHQATASATIESVVQNSVDRICIVLVVVREFREGDYRRQNRN
jgi:hypothetical protein